MNALRRWLLRFWLRIRRRMTEPIGWRVNQAEIAKAQQEQREIRAAILSLEAEVLGGRKR